MKCIGCDKTLNSIDLIKAFGENGELSKNSSCLWFELKCDVCGMQNEINYSMTDINGLEPVFAPDKCYV